MMRRKNRIEIFVWCKPFHQSILESNLIFNLFVLIWYKILYAQRKSTATFNVFRLKRFLYDNLYYLYSNNSAYIGTILQNQAKRFPELMKLFLEGDHNFFS